MIGQPNANGYAGHVRGLTAKNGKQYGWGMIDYSPMLFLRDGDIFKPVAGSIRVAFGPYGSGLLYPAMKDLYEKTKAGAFLWQDRNHDQTVQEDELVVSPTGRGETAFNWIDADFNAWCDAGFILRPARIEPDGRPVYDFSQREPIPFQGGNSNATSLYLDDARNVYTLSGGTFARWTHDWKPVWAYRGIVSWHQALGLPPDRLDGDDLGPLLPRGEGPLAGAEERPPTARGRCRPPALRSLPRLPPGRRCFTWQSAMTFATTHIRPFT